VDNKGAASARAAPFAFAIGPVVAFVGLSHDGAVAFAY